jgi:hypothetical protein
MSVVPFEIVNRERALNELIELQVNTPQDPAATSDRVLFLADSYCINPRCDCEIAHLDVIFCDGTIEGIKVDVASQTAHSVGKLDYKMAIGKEPVQLDVNIPKGTVEFPEGCGASPMEAEIRDQVRKELKPEHLETLRRHYQEAKAWGADNWWKHEDWTQLEEGPCVGWVDVFPMAKAWSWEVGGRVFIAEDQYCIKPACPCDEVILVFHHFDLATCEGRSAMLLGTVAHDLETGKRSIVELERGRPEELLRLADELFSRVSGLADELHRRRTFMREFGRHVEGQKRARAKSLPVRPAPSPGRNDPCPCGSGKKYKKCCLRGQK